MWEEIQQSGKMFGAHSVLGWDHCKRPVCISTSQGCITLNASYNYLIFPEPLHKSIHILSKKIIIVCEEYIPFFIK